jgi:hypothetical protein
MLLPLTSRMRTAMLQIISVLLLLLLLVMMMAEQSTKAQQSDRHVQAAEADQRNRIAAVTPCSK